MSGLNSIVGLNKVDVDYRPEVGQAEKSKGLSEAGGVQNGEYDIVDIGANEFLPEKSSARSVLRQLDVLLVNAATRSVTENAAKKAKDVGTTLQDLGVITASEALTIETLAKTAADKLKALDSFTGAEIANGTAKDAVDEAIGAQTSLSDALYYLKNRLYRSDKVSAELMDAFTEILLQSERRGTEFYSLEIRMRELAKQDALAGANGDPKVKEMLNAKFMDLVPREAIMMHGTADSIELMRKAFGSQVAPLAQKLDDFAANHGKDLTANDIAELKKCMGDMKDAIALVRKDGIAVGDGESNGRIAVDRSILDEMDRVLDEVDGKVSEATKHCARNMYASFIDDARDCLLPKSVPLPAVDPESPFGRYVGAVNRFTDALRNHADGNLTASGLDDEVQDINDSLVTLNASEIRQLGYSEGMAAKMVKDITKLELIAEQFKTLVRSAKEFVDGGSDAMVTKGDVRRMMLGELSVSSVVEARARGFKAGDVDPRADDANIVDCKALGSGQSNSTYILTTKNGEKLVFKPEFNGRMGLNRMTLGDGGAYSDVQNVANLNLATQETAEALGCGDIVVKNFVGSHNGQFGFFMENAPGLAGSKFAHRSQGDSADCVNPATIFADIADPAERTKVQGQLARQLNRLQWLDVVTGQGDRHWDNYLLHIDKTTHVVTLKAIDNDASFSAERIGVQKYRFSPAKSRWFKNALSVICQQIHGDDWKAEFNKCWKSAAVSCDVRTGRVTVDIAKVNKTSREAAIALSAMLGPQTIAHPDAIDKEFYDKLMELDTKPELKEKYFATIAPRLSSESLEAARTRLDDAIAYAKNLYKAGRVFDAAAWQDSTTLNSLGKLKASCNVYDTTGKRIELDCKSQNANLNKYTQKFLVNTCTSYYCRDFMNWLFREPSQKAKKKDAGKV
ncbi:MAG: hypothetical protein IKE55_06740 [Kiritimatiellae bacterium]|nr:hypothetical protein [Kiritimatiellia bacterium]